MVGKNLNEEIDLRELLLKLWKYKVFILIFTVFALIASALAANMIKPKYKSQASVVPNLMEFKKIEISRLKEDILKEYSNNTIINLNEVNSRINQLYSPGKDINYLIITSMPKTPYEPYSPKRFKIVFLSTFSAFLLSIFIALFYDWLKTEK